MNRYGRVLTGTVVQLTPPLRLYSTEAAGRPPAVTSIVAAMHVVGSVLAGTTVSATCGEAPATCTVTSAVSALPSLSVAVS